METADKSDWPSQTSGGLLRYVDDKIKWEIGNSESLHKYRFMRLFHRLKIQYLKCKIIHSLQKKRNLVVILKLKEYLLWPFFRFEKQTFTFVASTNLVMDITATDWELQCCVSAIFSSLSSLSLLLKVLNIGLIKNKSFRETQLTTFLIKDWKGIFWFANPFNYQFRFW